MSGRSLIGLAAFDALLLTTGLAVLFAFLGRLDRRTVARYGGLAFWLGASLVGLALTLIGILTTLGPRWWLVLAIALTQAVVATGVGLRRRPRTERALATDGGRFGLAAAPFAAATGLVLAALFAASYNRPLFEWDSLAFWIPKAKELFFSGSLDAGAITSYSGTNYPLLVPMLHASAFGFMGSADEVAIHVQPWMFMAMFVWACVGLLRPRASHALIWPFLALLVVLPTVGQRVLYPDGDYPSFLLFVLGALALLRWVEQEEPFALAAGAVFLAAAASAKREGTVYLLAAFLAAFAVTARSARRRWPVLALAAVGALATTVPWRLWVRAHNVVADSVAPPLSNVVGGSGGGYGGVWRGVEAVLHYVFLYSSWSIAPWIGLIMLVCAFVFGPLRIAAFATIALLPVIAAMVWRVLWYGGQATPKETPIPRLSVLFSMLLLAISPWIATALLRLDPGGVCSRVIDAVDRLGVRLGRVGLVALAVAPAAIFLGVGLARGDYAFIAGRCDPALVEGQPVAVVFGYPTTFDDAVALRDKALRVGFVGTATGFDQCGRLRVALANVPSPKVGREIQAEARLVELFPVLVGRQG